MPREDLSAVGLRLLGTRSDLGELAALDTTILKNGSLVFVTNVAGVYAFIRESDQPAQGINTVAPSLGPGRWVRQNQGTQQFASQREWFIHAEGDDLGPGTESYPLRTGAELSMRLAGVLEPEDTTVYYLSDMLPNDYLIGPAALAPGASFLATAPDLPVLGEVTITAYQEGDPATNARNRVTAAGANWAAPFVGKRYEVPTRSIYGWIDKVDPADNTRAFISTPLDQINYVVPTLAPGDVLRFTETRHIGRMLQVVGSPDAYAMVEGIRVQNESPGFAQSSGVSLGLNSFAYNCKFDTQKFWLGSQAYLENCHIGYSPGTFGILFSLDAYLYFGFNRGGLVWSGPGTLTVMGLTTSDTKVDFRNQLEVDMTSDTPKSNNSFWDWAAGLPAIELEPGTFLNHRVRCYGRSAASNTYGFSFNTGSAGHVQGGGVASNRPNIIGTLGTGGSNTRDMNIAGTNVLYAGLPFVNTTNYTRFVTRFSS